jgi:hypothetical protein
VLSLLHAVARELAGRRIPHALIGAGAMAVHGVVRATADLDLLVTDRAVLAADTWRTLEDTGIAVERRPGDDADPLAGVVRFSGPSEAAVDLVVGRHGWQSALLARATPHLVGAEPLPVVAPADLILLKVYAGSSRDLHDVEELLDSGDRTALQAAVDREIDRLPADARDAWRRLARSSGG